MTVERGILGTPYLIIVSSSGRMRPLHIPDCLVDFMVAATGWADKGFNPRAVGFTSRRVKEKQHMKVVGREPHHPWVLRKPTAALRQAQDWAWALRNVNQQGRRQAQA